MFQSCDSKRVRCHHWKSSKGTERYNVGFTVCQFPCKILILSFQSQSCWSCSSSNFDSYVDDQLCRLRKIARCVDCNGCCITWDWHSWSCIGGSLGCTQPREMTSPEMVVYQKNLRKNAQNGSGIQGLDLYNVLICPKFRQTRTTTESWMYSYHRWLGGSRSRNFQQSLAEHRRSSLIMQNLPHPRPASSRVVL